MRFFLFFLVIMTAISCKQNISPEQKALTTSLDAYKANPSDKAAADVKAGFDAYIQARGYSDPQTPDLLLQMVSFAQERNDSRQAFDYYKSYLVEYPGRPDVADRLADVINVASGLNQPELTDILYKSFTTRFPKDARTAEFESKIQNKDIATDSLIRRVGATMFNDSTFRLNENRARLYVDLCEAGVMADPTLSNGPELLHRGAETARTLRDVTRAIRMYDWIMTKYPDHPRAPVSMFLKAFTYDNEMKDFEKAGALYNEFIAKYPKSEYAESAKFLLDNLGKSDQEWLKVLEKKKEEVQ